MYKHIHNSHAKSMWMRDGMKRCYCYVYQGNMPTFNLDSYFTLLDSKFHAICMYIYHTKLFQCIRQFTMYGLCTWIWITHKHFTLAVSHFGIVFMLDGCFPFSHFLSIRLG